MDNRKIGAKEIDFMDCCDRNNSSLIINWRTNNRILSVLNKIEIKSRKLRDAWEEFFDRSEIKECNKCGKINLFIKTPVVINNEPYMMREVLFDPDREGHYEWCSIRIT